MVRPHPILKFFDSGASYYLILDVSDAGYPQLKYVNNFSTVDIYFDIFMRYGPFRGDLILLSQLRKFEFCNAQKNSRVIELVRLYMK